MTNQRPLAWVTGAAGLIGSYLVRLGSTSAGNWNVRGLTRADLDLTDFTAVRAAFERDRPALVIHCAALSRSPDCEANPGLARLLNVDVTRVLADLCQNGSLVYFSTDLIFDGRQGNYDETAAPRPFGAYAETKAAGEAPVLAHPRHLVIRTSLNGGRSPTRDRGFNEQIRRAWESGRTLRLFTDEFRSPTHAEVTARAVWELVAAGASGVYNVAGTQRLSRYEIGQLVASRVPHLKPGIEPASLREYQGAPRPPDTTLNCAKAQALLSFRLPGLREWLAAHPDGEF